MKYCSLASGSDGSSSSRTLSRAALSSSVLTPEAEAAAPACDCVAFLIFFLSFPVIGVRQFSVWYKDSCQSGDIRRRLRKSLSVLRL